MLTRRLTARDVLVVLQMLPGTDPEQERIRLTEQLQEHYEPVLGPGVAVVTEVFPGCRTVVAVVAPASAQDWPGLPWVWGLPIGAAGEATGQEVRAALAAPRSAGRLLGSFVLLGEHGDGLRLVTGPDIVHTLARCDGPRGAAWSTKSWAALIVAGVPPRLALDRVPEYVLFDQVWGDDELLDGPVLCEEATVVDLTSSGAVERSWWPVADRLAPGAPTGGPALRAVLTEELDRIGRLPELVLALTAGRDSTLVASCLRDLQLAPLAYTIGGPGSPDFDGAAATAAASGWQHLSVLPQTGPARGMADVVRASAWTEGLDTAWNLYGPPLQWPGQPDRAHLSGNGGEIGRAFYYQHGAVPRTPDEVLHRLTASGLTLADAPRRALRDRLDAALRPALVLAEGDCPRALDLLYARVRVRSWLNRTVMRPDTSAIVPAYTSPAVVRVLLDLPLGDRRSAAAFDAALGADGLRLREAAAQLHRPTLGRRSATSVSAALRGKIPGAHRLLQRRPALLDTAGLQALELAMAELPNGPVIAREALGERWWEDTLARAALDGNARRHLWNALAVEALHVRVQGSSSGNP